MNNLDPEVAEHPEDLVVYGGTGKAARTWEAYDAIVRTLDELEPDETLLVQSGKPVGVFRTHEWAPRVLIANSNLVGDWATWPEFRRLEELGLTMYGQMTAGSWIYIGTQGILQGTYETFAAVARSLGRERPHRHADPHGGCGGMGGAQPLAVTHERRRGAHRRRRRVAPRAPRRARLPRRVHDRPRCGDRTRRRGEGGGRGAVGRRRRQRRRGLRRPAAARRADRHRHRPDERPRPARVPAGRHRRSRTGRPRPSATPRPSRRGRAAAWPSTSRRWSDSRMPEPRCSTTATRSAARRSSAASSGRSSSRDSCPPTSGRSSPRARGPFRWVALSGDPEDIRKTDEAVKALFPENAGLHPLARQGRRAVHFEGLPARICWLGYKERHLAGLKFNEMVASGELSAPIVIGRDHLDSGSVASPYRETEAMADGSDAIADWPLLNALLNTVERRVVGLDPPRRRRRHRPQHPCRTGHRRRRHGARRREARARAHERPGHRASCATSTPATTGRRRSRASAASRSRCSERAVTAGGCGSAARRWCDVPDPPRQAAEPAEVADIEGGT